MPNSSRGFTPNIWKTPPPWMSIGGSFLPAWTMIPASAKQQVSGPSWARKDWPLAPTGDLVSAFDGNWPAVEKAIGSKIEAKSKAAGAGLSVEKCARPPWIRCAP